MWVALEAKDATEEERETLRKFGRSFVAQRHDQLDTMIGDSDYLLGDKPTLADAIFAGVARWADFHQAINPQDYPRILALRQRIEADPAFRFALAIEDGKPAIGTGAMRFRDGVRGCPPSHGSGPRAFTRTGRKASCRS